jgi:hypothetical protein
MIGISLSHLIILVMCAGFLLIGVLWLVSFWQERRRELHHRRVAVQCRICGCGFTRRPDSDISICPLCHSPNERQPDRSI